MGYGKPGKSWNLSVVQRKALKSMNPATSQGVFLCTCAYKTLCLLLATYCTETHTTQNAILMLLTIGSFFYNLDFC